MLDPTNAVASIPPFLDIEASGFGRGIYPIEVGAVLSVGSAFCTLIRPKPWAIRRDNPGMRYSPRQ